MRHSAMDVRSTLMLWLVCLLMSQHLWLIAARNETEQYANNQGPLYHTTFSIIRHLQRLDSSFVRHIALKDTLSKRYATGQLASSNRTQHMFRVVNRAVVTSEQQEKQLPTAFLVCNQHAREVITGEICYWLVRLLAQDTSTLMEWPAFREVITKGTGAERLGSDPTQHEARLKQWVAEITSKIKVEVVPVANQEGRDYIQRTGDFAQRKTIKTQVDLNRNWPVNRARRGSGASELDKDGAEYQGPRALSEWQTRTLYAYMKLIPQRTLYMDVHSGLWSLMCPWGGSFNYHKLRNGTAAGCQALFDIMQPAFRALVNDSLITPFSDKGIATGPGSGMLYKSEGSSDDTAYADVGFQHALTVETYALPGASDSGISFTCPMMDEWSLYCNERNRCGDHVCVDRNGALLLPSPGKKAATAAAVPPMASQLQGHLLHTDTSNKLQIATYSGEDLQAPIPSATASTAAAAAVRPMQQYTNVPNADQDPFLSKLSTGSNPGVFMLFNPTGAAGYRMTVSRWCAAILFALDKVVSDLQ